MIALAGLDWDWGCGDSVRTVKSQNGCLQRNWTGRWRQPGWAERPRQIASVNAFGRRVRPVWMTRGRKQKKRGNTAKWRGFLPPSVLYYGLGTLASPRACGAIGVADRHQEKSPKAGTRGTTLNHARPFRTVFLPFLVLYLPGQQAHCSSTD